MNVVLLAFSTLRSTEFSLTLFCKLQLYSPFFCRFNSVYLIFQNFQSFLAHFWIQTTSEPSTVIVQIISPESDTSRTYWAVQFKVFHSVFSFFHPPWCSSGLLSWLFGWPPAYHPACEDFGWQLYFKPSPASPEQREWLHVNNVNYFKYTSLE